MTINFKCQIETEIELDVKTNIITNIKQSTTSFSHPPSLSHPASTCFPVHNINITFLHPPKALSPRHQPVRAFQSVILIMRNTITKEFVGYSSMTNELSYDGIKLHKISKLSGIIYTFVKPSAFTAISISLGRLVQIKLKQMAKLWL